MELPQKRILIVDDFKDGRELYELILSQKGFRVTAAKDGQEALDKADERTRQIPVLVLTAHELHKATAALGCDGFLVKPCLPDVMIAEIVRILGKDAQGGVAASSPGRQAAGAKQGGTQAGPRMR